MRLIEFFQDDKGVLSNARLANFLIVGGFIGDWVAHIVRNIAFEPVWSLVSLVAAGMGIKVMQKRMEGNKDV